MEVIATLSAVFKIFDGASGPLSNINRKANESTDKILKASGATDKFNNKLNATGASASNASSGLGKFLSVAASVAGAIKGMSIVDEYTNTSARLGLINDGLQTQAELQDKIFAAANRSRGAYGDMASSVAKLQMLAGDAFGSNDETIAFTELMQKSFKLGGSSQSEQSSGMYQLTQAMAAGKLQGDEFKSIQENAPMLSRAIEDYMKNIVKAEGTMKDWSSQGLLTAQVIKNALFMAGGDIEEKFATLPMTFADYWNQIKNGGMKAFVFIMEKVNKLINNNTFKKFIDVLIASFDLLAKAVNWLIDIIVNNWGTIKTILKVIGTVLLANIISKIISTTSALIAQAAAWLTVYWPILLVVGAIAAAIWIAREFGATWEEIFGTAGGTVALFVADFNNSIASMWNPVVAFINFCGNAFNNLGSSIKILFLDIAYSVINSIASMASGIEGIINKFSGVDLDLSSGYDKILGGIESKNSKLKKDSGWKEIVAPMEYMNYSESYKKGSSAGKNILDTVNKATKTFSDAINNSGFDPSKYMNSPLTVEGKGKNKKVDVDMDDEDLKYLRDIAERDYINKFSTATLAPNVQFNFSDIKETADINVIKGTLEKMMREEISTASEGVY